MHLKRKALLCLPILLLAVPEAESYRNSRMMVGTWRLSNPQGSRVIHICAEGTMLSTDADCSNAVSSLYRRYGIWGVKMQSIIGREPPKNWIHNVFDRLHLVETALSQCRFCVSLLGTHLNIKELGGTPEGNDFYRIG